MNIHQWREVAEVERGRSLAFDLYEQMREGHMSGDPTRVVHDVEDREIESDIDTPDRFESVVHLGSGAVIWASELFHQFTAEVQPPLTDEGKQEGFIEFDRLLSNWHFDLQFTEEFHALASEIDALALTVKYVSRVTSERARAIVYGKIPDRAYVLHRARELVKQDILIWKQACQNEMER